MYAAILDLDRRERGNVARQGGKKHVTFCTYHIRGGMTGKRGKESFFLSRSGEKFAKKGRKESFFRHVARTNSWIAVLERESTWNACRAV